MPKVMRYMLSKNWLIYRIHDRALLETSSRYLHGRVIDIGCGTKPYAELLRALVDEHIGVDIEDTPHPKINIDLFGSAYSVPVDDASFDCAICTAVLEHLEEPGMAVRETHRLLKPGGLAIYSVPLIWHVHEGPRDFYRFTKYGLRYIFEKNSFDIIELEPLSGFWVTFGQELVYYIWGFMGKSWLTSRLIPVLGMLIQASCYLLNSIDGRDEFTWMYMVVARKKDSPQG